MTPTVRVFATDLATGEEFECFVWTRDAASGIARAYSDAKRFGMEIRDARAEAIA